MSTLSVGLLLYPGFEVLDVAGPIEVLNIVCRILQKPLKLSVISKTLDAVSPGFGGSDHTTPFLNPQRYLPTHTVGNSPALDLLIVPGGFGLRAPREELQPYIDFIARVYKGSEGQPAVKNLFSICTGSVLFALAGVLDGRTVTTNKRSWKWATPQGPKTTWIARARWVIDGNIWSTSGVSAGTDGMVAFVAAMYGEAAADEVCHVIEHDRVKDADNDPWAAVNSCEDVHPLAGN